MCPSDYIRKTVSVLKKKIPFGKVVAIALAAVIGLGVLSSCGDTTDNTDKYNEPSSQMVETQNQQRNDNDTPEFADEEKDEDTQQKQDILQPSDESAPERDPNPEPEPEPDHTTEPEPEPESEVESEPETEIEPEPEVDSEQTSRDKLLEYNYIGSSQSDKYHKPTCRWTDKINDENLIHFDTEEEAVAAGYQPCGTCKP